MHGGLPGRPPCISFLPALIQAVFHGLLGCLDTMRHYKGWGMVGIEDGVCGVFVGSEC